MTIRETLNKGTELLSIPRESSHIDTPALDAALLLAETLHIRREDLIINAGDTVGEKKYTDYTRLLKRRVEGECVAYILGRKEFYGLEFLVNKSVLVPRPETETLVEAAVNILDSIEKLNDIDAANAEPLKVLDLCTGSGAAAIALKYTRPQTEVWAADISPEALAVAKTNCERLITLCVTRNITHSVAHDVAHNAGKTRSIHFVESDLFCAINDRFHLIMTNPPYVKPEDIKALPPEVQGEPLLALDGGKDGLDIIRRIIKEAPAHLLPKGMLLMEADPRQMSEIKKLLENNHFENIKIHKDLTNERVISASCH